uniref:Uncharacterized protein n=1 Tax=Rhizophora mucronata TaxID=61149 RepID=A0A2P2J5H6_RHIMU
MDKTETGKKAPEEVTRESLIALSYSLPEKVVASKLFGENVDRENLVGGIDGEGDGVDTYRSELISISSLQSPDVQGLPVVPCGETEGSSPPPCPSIA